jgi:hypothetical protein
VLIHKKKHQPRSGQKQYIILLSPTTTTTTTTTTRPNKFPHHYYNSFLTTTTTTKCFFCSHVSSIKGFFGDGLLCNKTWNHLNLNEAKNIILIMMILTAADIISYINTQFKN